LFISIVLHEYAHGWAANKLGDPTAKLAGRLTLNPLKHIDLIGTILAPSFLFVIYLIGLSHNFFIFGWAKPVPVNFQQLRHPKRDMILVGLAGPATNIILAALASLVYHQTSSPFWAEVCLGFIFLNLLLAVFNMIPIPPLDGSRLVAGLLPDRLAFYYTRLERYGILIVIIATMYLNIFDLFVSPGIDFLGHFLGVDFKGALN
jgi:Zn-dependent protease